MKIGLIQTDWLTADDGKGVLDMDFVFASEGRSQGADPDVLALFQESLRDLGTRS